MLLESRLLNRRLSLRLLVHALLQNFTLDDAFSLFDTSSKGPYNLFGLLVVDVGELGGEAGVLENEETRFMLSKRIYWRIFMLGGGSTKFHHSKEQHYHDRVVEIFLKALKGKLVEIVIDGLHARSWIRLALKML